MSQCGAMRPTMDDFTFRIRPSIMPTEYSTNAGFNTQFSPKHKATMEFDIILGLMLIVSQQITRLNTRVSD